MFLDATHFVVCKNRTTLTFLTKQYPLIGYRSKSNQAMLAGDAFVARDLLLRAGFKWGIDFYLRVKGIGTDG